MKTFSPSHQASNLQKTQQALLRASEKARELAQQTGTPFVVREPSNIPRKSGIQNKS